MHDGRDVFAGKGKAVDVWGGGHTSTEEKNRKTLKTRSSQWEKGKEGKPVFVEMGVESQARYCWVLLMIRGRKTRDYTIAGQVSSCARIWGGGLGRE